MIIINEIFARFSYYWFLAAAAPEEPPRERLLYPRPLSMTFSQYKNLIEMVDSVQFSQLSQQNKVVLGLLNEIMLVYQTSLDQ